MIVFLDTSALVKLYHQEAFSTELKSYLANESEALALVIAKLGVVEYTSAIWKKHRTLAPAVSSSAPTHIGLRVKYFGPPPPAKM